TLRLKKKKQPRKNIMRKACGQIFMETDESPQDGSVTASVTDSDSVHVQTQTGQNSIPTLAQVSVAGPSTGRALQLQL
uniref:Uncharacterized protein n=1 Tax=Vombatus ursinus TaxID=29139 RepID=A0A4X2KLN3_VOMUR